MKNWKMWLINIGLLGLVLGLLSCAGVKPKVEPEFQPNVWATSFGPVSTMNGDIGTVGCDYLDQPIILLNEDVGPKIPQWRWRYVILHERVHIRQFRERHLSCHAAQMKATQEPLWILKLELEAHCVEYTAIGKDLGWQHPDSVYNGTFGPLFLRFHERLPDLTTEKYAEMIPCSPLTRPP